MVSLLTIVAIETIIAVGGDYMYDIEKILEFVLSDDADFVREILKGATEEDIEAYFEEFPEYRVYWDGN